MHRLVARAHAQLPHHCYELVLIQLAVAVLVPQVPHAVHLRQLRCARRQILCQLRPRRCDAPHDIAALLLGGRVVHQAKVLLQGDGVSAALLHQHLDARQEGGEHPRGAPRLLGDALLGHGPRVSHEVIVHRLHRHLPAAALVHAVEVVLVDQQLFHRHKRVLHPQHSTAPPRRRTRGGCGRESTSLPGRLRGLREAQPPGSCKALGGRPGGVGRQRRNSMLRVRRGLYLLMLLSPGACVPASFIQQGQRVAQSVRSGNRELQRQQRSTCRTDGVSLVQLAGASVRLAKSLEIPASPRDQPHQSASPVERRLLQRLRRGEAVAYRSHLPGGL
mmetsp:Transcript_40673/g.77643  ORF Transcript_40673/g.77643 Transcript_40673/m.77643 type:complete len:332 (+) Transcript_40673:794-1789(+)